MSVARSVRVALLVVLPVLLVPAGSASGEVLSSVKLASGEKRVTYRIGPFDVIPGQNEIRNRVITDKPQVDGFITRIRPDLTYVNGKVPRVDVIHLHHGVWANVSRGLELFFAAGEEKTILDFPKGFGYRYERSNVWFLNHMIHNLTPVPTQVYMVYEVDFIPADAPAARGIQAARPIWMDVMRGSGYPVFNVEKGSGGRDGRYTFPDDDPNAYASGWKRNEWVANRDGVLIDTAGHLHPGGLHTDLYLRREGARLARRNCGGLRSTSAGRRCRRNAPRGKGDTAHLFRSKAKYYEPAGAVSWDVSMTATRDDWRVKVKKGDVLVTNATYDSKRGAWWESMGIMLVYMADDVPGRDPFTKRVDYPGRVTHGHLPENNNHGGKRTGLPDPRKLGDGVVNPGSVDILGFNYRLGDLRLDGRAGRPPVIAPGQSLTFNNADEPRRIYHSITSCKPPCNRSTGIAYPLADSRVQFESGTLGNDGQPTVGSLTWETPKTLKPSTYTYFCRIHPFMRGAFRVKR